MKSISLILAASLAAAASVSVTGCMSDDGLELSEAFEELAVSQWQDDIRVDGQSSAKQPGVAWFNNRVHMVHNGSGDAKELWYSVRDEVRKSWSTNFKIQNLRADGGPSLVAWDGRLTMIIRQGNRLVMSKMNGDQSWSLPAQIGTGVATRSAPSAVVTGGKLYVGYCDSNGPRVDVLDGPAGQWAPSWSTSDGDYDCQTVALGADDTRGILHVGYTTFWTAWWTGTEFWQVNTSKAVVRNGNATWDANPVFHEMDSKKPMSITTCNGVTHLVHGGNADPNGIYWTTFDYAAGRWLPDAKVPSQASDDGAQLGCAGSTAFMIHNGGTDQLWYSEFR